MAFHPHEAESLEPTAFDLGGANGEEREVCKPRKRGWLALTAIWIGLLISALPAVAAQGAGGRVRGTVQEASGTPVPRVQVTVRNVGTGLSRSTSCDDTGQFEVAELPPGTYQVEVAGDGAGPQGPQRIELARGETRALTLVLPPRPPESPQQESGAAKLSSSTTGNLIRESQLAGLPLNGRSYSQLATLQSSVSDTATTSSSRGTGGGYLNIAGGRGFSNNFLLDGTSILDTENEVPRSAAGVQLGSDAIFQVQVFSAHYGAEFGKTSGGVLNSITRSGTPQFHGTFFEYFRNSKLDARNFFDRDPEPPPFKRNQFGFTLTGPIVKDKTFFMASFEAMRDRLNQTNVSYFPDAGARSGDVGGGRIIPVAPRVVPYLALFPLPNDISLGRGIGRDMTPQFLPTDENFVTVRVDHKLSERDSFFARYTFDGASSYSAQETHLYRTRTDSRQQFLTLVGTHIFSPRTLLAFRFGFTRPVSTARTVAETALPRSLFFIPGADQFGQILIPGLSAFGPSTSLPRTDILNSFQYAQDTFLQRGSHGLKMGFDIHRYQWNGGSDWYKGGVWSFNSLESFLAAGPIGTSMSAALPGSSNIHGLRETLAGFYFQDEYKVRPRLQVTLGLRYEFATMVQDTLNKMSYMSDPVRDTEVRLGHYYKDNPTLRNFAPRISASWSPEAGRGTLFSAGFGIYYDTVIGFGAVHRKSSLPFYRVVVNPNFDSTRTFPDVLAASAGVPLLAQIMDYNDLVTPVVYRYTASLQRPLPGNWQVQASYVGARGNHLYRRFEFNQFPVPVTRPDGSLFFPPGAGSINPAFGSMNTITTDAQSFYNSLQLSAGRNVGRGLSLQASYTFSKSVDDSSVGPLPSSAPQYGLIRTLDRGLSDFDLRHRLVLNYFYTLPFGQSQRGGAAGILAKALGGWRLGGITSFRSGVPMTARVSVRYQDYLFVANRPNLLPGRSNNPIEGVAESCGPTLGGQKLGEPDLYYDPCAFAAPPPGQLGNLGRNTIIAPSVFSMDFSLQREFFLDARKRLQFRAEVFNLPNHTNFAPSTGNGLVVYSGESGIRNATAGRISRTATTARQIQFALRFSF
ncbi:MAG: hypothetical protein A3H28_06225 [Acidobacteria bacterium RIFCSPLOWO2_02_FULL_61_28]|nr:MAG: hypothetical protein A3H28_06225 [Acidobacteria bacterium RIFCSPLOWO2_02_FULL_61_28]